MSSTKPIDHSARSHALLSASGASRWLNCSPSARIEDKYPDIDTVYSKQGEKAHELAEQMLQAYLDNGNDKAYDIYNTAIKQDPDMSSVIEYYQYVVNRAEEAKAQYSDVAVLLETRLDFGRWVPEGFGTGDALIIYGNTVEVIDLKYGQGEQVEAQDNPQLQIYGLGAYELASAIYEIERVTMTIVQPRRNHTSTQALPLGALLIWAENYLKPKAELAYSGKGSLCAGAHCRFCKIRAICPERSKSNMEIIKASQNSVELLTNDQVAEVLPKLDQAEKWIKSVKEYAVKEIEAGREIRGYKLVEGKSMRKVSDERGLVEKLMANGVPEAMIYTKSIASLGTLEKLAGGAKKFKEEYEQFVTKPKGKPTLAPIDDPRPDYRTTAESDFAELEKIL